MSEPEMTLPTDVKLTIPAIAELPTVPGYEVVKLLGQGGMGQVYQARHLKMQRVVALKLTQSANHEPALARFEEEVKAIASLRHANIAQIYESGQVDGRPFYAMEYVAGGNLSDRLKPGPLPPRQAAELLSLLARAMKHAHEQHILHRDLKPSNILLEEGTLQPKIADFGLAKRLKEDTKLTRTGDIFGSPSYMAPEQASGVMKLSASVDVYALGAVLYECVTGRPPFMGPDAMQTLMQVLSDDPVPPKHLQPKLPRDLETICLKCLEKLPKRRYGSAQALAEDLERYLKGEPILARPISSVERLQKWVVRKPWQAVAVGLVATLMLGLVSGLGFLQGAYRESQKASDDANKSFDLSKHTLDAVLSNVTGELSLVPNMERVAVESYRPAIALYRELHGLRPDHLPTSLEYLDKLYEFSVKQILAHQDTEAKQTLEDYDSLLRSELRRYPDDQALQIEQVRFLLNRAWFAGRVNKMTEAKEDKNQARLLLNELLTRYPNNVKLLTQSIDLLQADINEKISQNQPDDVLPMYRQKLASYEKLYELRPDQDHAQLVLSGMRSLATWLLAMKQLPEADSYYRAIEKRLATIQLKEPERLNLQVTLKKARSDLLRFQLQPDASLKELLEAEKYNNQLLDRFPEYSTYLYDRFDILTKKAVLTYQLGQVSEGIDQMKRCIQQTENFLKTHANYTTIADHLTKQRQALSILEDQAKLPPRGDHGRPH